MYLEDARRRQDVLVVEVGGDDAVVEQLVRVDAVEGVKPGDAERGALKIHENSLTINYGWTSKFKKSHYRRR